MPTVLNLGSNPPAAEGVDFRELFESLPDPAAYVAPDNRVAACNRSFRERFPVLIESRFLKPLQNALEMGGSLPVVQPKRQSIAGGGTWPALEPRVTRLACGGALVVFHPLKNAVLEQRAEMERLREELAVAQDEVRNAMGAVANVAKHFADVSHELRTPLNAVVGFSDAIRQEIFGSVGDPHYRRYADIIYDSGLRLLDLVNDVLDFAKLDAGKCQFHPQEVEVLRPVIESVREVEMRAAKSHIGIRIHICDGVSTVVSDPKRLRQMLANLLSNALKFTPAGGEISIDVFKRSDQIAISVSDTGIGMNDFEIPVALEPFGRLAGGARYNSTGTGLGLPLTKHLAQLHGGTIELESAPGAGTTVTILLPARHDDVAQRLERTKLETYSSQMN